MVVRFDEEWPVTEYIEQKFSCGVHYEKNAFSLQPVENTAVDIVRHGRRILPARTRTSPSVSTLSFSVSSATFPLLISGPIPLISVPSILLSFTLMREIPFSIRIKSERIPISSALRTISVPVKPATNPSAVLSIPRFVRIVDTLIPFPPAGAVPNLSGS